VYPPCGQERKFWWILGPIVEYVGLALLIERLRIFNVKKKIYLFVRASWCRYQTQKGEMFAVGSRLDVHCKRASRANFL
jgi:hypothetical protein